MRQQEFELTGGAVGNIHRQQELFEAEEIVAVRVKDPQYVVDKVFSIPCKNLVVDPRNKEKRYLADRGSLLSPSVGPLSASHSGIHPWETVSNTRQKFDLNLRNHWSISSSEKSVFSRQKSRSVGLK